MNYKIDKKQETKDRVVYEPAANRITFFKNDKPAGGACGHIAERSFQKALVSGRQIIIK